METVALVFSREGYNEPQLLGVCKDKFDANNLCDALADFQQNEQYRHVDLQGLVYYSIPDESCSILSYFVVETRFGRFHW